MNHPVALPHHLCYLNGEYLPLNEARVSVLDRGFIFGDGIYEVVPVYGGKPFRWAHHHARMARSLQEVRIPHTDDAATWAARIDHLVNAHAAHTGQPVGDIQQLIYIQITRGVAPRDHVIDPQLSPTVFAMVNAMKPPSAEQREHGVSCVSAHDFRWEKGHIKSISLLSAILARDISHQAHAVETVMFRNGHLTEASASNVWVVKNGSVMAAPKDNLVLEGIRYGLLEELCAQEGLSYELRPIRRSEVFDADELLLTSATKEVLPITHLDGQAIGHGAQAGRPGPIYQRLYQAYQKVKQ
jgi:D-alanine transaminase